MKEKYFGGSTDLGLDFLATVANLVAVVSLAMIGDLAVIKWDPHQMIRCMAWFCRAWTMYSFSISHLL